MFRKLNLRLITLCVLVFLLSNLVTFSIIILTGSNASPVSIEVGSTVSKDLSDVDVYRISLNNNPKPLTTRFYTNPNNITVKDVLLNSYFKSIQIKLSDHALNNLSIVNVKIGNRKFSFSRQELVSQWRLIRRSPNQYLYQAPDNVAVDRSALPFLNTIINLNLDSSIIGDVLVHKLALLFLILIFLYSLTPTGRQSLAHINYWINHEDNRLIYVSGILALLITLYRMPYAIWPMDQGLDPSWVIGLNWAYTKGLQWGQDLVFTYGPYYWLLYPSILLSSSMLKLSLIVTTSIFIYSAGIFIYYLLRQIQLGKLPVLPVLLAIFTLSFFEYTLNDIVVVAAILLLAVNERHSYFKHIMPSCFLLAILSLCKFSYLAVSICVVVFCSCRYVSDKRYGTLMSINLTFVSFLCMLWVLSGQPIQNLWLFINRGYDIAQGYSEAMATPIWNINQSILGNIMTNMLFLGLGLFLVSGVVILFFNSLRKNGIWFELLLCAPVLFLAFKEGFIRMDLSHAVLFFAQFLVIIIALLLFYGNKNNTFSPIHNILIGSFIILVIFVDGHLPAGYNPDLPAVFSKSERTDLLNESKERLRSAYPLKKDIEKSISKSSIDIIPYDISLLYAYDFNWFPRLVFQSYSVHSSRLDSLNALHFSIPPMPDKLLFYFKSIDNHYPLFDEPALVRSLIKNYEIEESYATNYLLLRRQLNPVANTNPVQSIATTCSINDKIPIPTKSGHYTYLYADIELTLLGKILNFLLKIQPLFIDFTLTNNSQPQQFRAIRQTVKDGLLVSSFAENLKMVSSILSGDAKPNVKSVKFIGNPLLYRSDIKVVFRFEAKP